MAHFTSLIDMAQTPDDVKKDVASYPAPMCDAKPSAPVYPYGLCIALTEKELAKLKIDELPKTGDTIHLCAFAKVTAVSENEREDTDGKKTKCCRVELQITQLATESEDDEHVVTERKESARRGRFYGGDEEGE